MENPIKMDDLGVPLFSETSIRDDSKDFAKVFLCVAGVEFGTLQDTLATNQWGYSINIH